MPHAWDPDRYLVYADERGRPFVELLRRVGATTPSLVADLGCGPGNLTALLAERWPTARVVGVDSSDAMIERARLDHTDIDWTLDDLATWAPPAPVDVLVTNAALQWVPGHLDLLPRLVGHLAPGGWLAMQVPGNFAEPSHRVRDELAAAPEFAAHTAHVATPTAHDAATYLRVLSSLGLEADAWETTYLHVLHGEDAVFDWVRGTGSRPTLEALPGTLRPRFESLFRERLRAAYPADARGRVVLPFRRVFAVARRA